MQQQTAVTLRQALGNAALPFSEQEPLAPHTTFRIGGAARFWLTPKNTAQLREILALCRAHGVRRYLLGNGSNTLFSDEGFDGAVIDLRGIDAPAICDERVVTNDLAELTPEGFFHIRGRRDNVICTGGLKLQTETLEAQLEGLPFAFQLTHVPDARWGEAVTLLYEAEADCAQRIADFCRERLDRHARPRHILRVDRLPLTETGKPARRAAQALAEKMLRGE